MYKNKTSLLCISILIIWLAAGGKAYASDPLTISVEAGFAGKCKMGEINPVRIVLESKGQDLEGALTVKVDEEIYRRQVNLPAGTKKIFPFSIPVLKESREITVSFDKNGESLAGRRVPLEILPANSLFVGLLSETPEELYYIGKMKTRLPPGDRDVVAVNLNGDLDYTPAEMQNFNLIIVDNFNTGSLTGDRQELIKNWLSGGGLALVGTGRYGYKNLTGIFSDLDGVKRTGSGCVVILPASLLGSGDPSVVEKALEQHITSEGLERLVNGSDLSRQAGAAREMRAAADSLFQPTYNTLFFLLALVVVYLILLGAGIFWDKRPRWSVPAIVAGFSVLFYLLAWSGGLHRSKAVCAGLKIHQNNTVSYSLINIYPYRQQQLQVRLPGALFMTGLGSGSCSMDPLANEITYYGGGPHYLYSRQVLPGSGAFPQLSLHRDLLTGEIKNPLASGLSNCCLLAGDTVIGLGDLAGKGKVRINYRLDHGLSNLGDYNYLDSVSRAGEMDNYRRELLEYYFYHAEDRSHGCKMLGFSSSERELPVNGRVQKIKELTLHVFPVRLESGPDLVSLPPGVVQPVVDCGKNLSANIKNEYTLQEGGELAAYYVLPPELQAGEISVWTRVEGGTVSLEVFNRRQGSWEPLVAGALRGAGLENYISGGPLAIKVKGSGRVMIPQISIQARGNPGGGTGD